MFKEIIGFILSQSLAMFAENRPSKYGGKEGEHARVCADVVMNIDFRMEKHCIVK